MGDYRLSDRLTIDEFAELAGLDTTTASALFAYYGAHQGEYDLLQTDLHQYKVPLIDLFLFLYDIAENGDVELSQDKLDMIESLYAQLADAKAQLQGKKYSRMLVYCDTPVQSEESYTIIENIHATAAEYYGDDVYVTGDAVASRDLEDSFSTDNIMVSILSAVFVIAVILLVFRSFGLAVLLIIVIQGSIWLNFSISYFTGNRISHSQRHSDGRKHRLCHCHIKPLPRFASGALLAQKGDTHRAQRRIAHACHLRQHSRYCGFAHRIYKHRGYHSGHRSYARARNAHLACAGAVRAAAGAHLGR